MRRPRATAGFLALLTGGCVAGCAGGTTLIGQAPFCGTGSDRDAGHGVILMAQSVPTASWVPCVRGPLPLGWNFHDLDARNGVSRFWLDSDRDGQKAIEVRLEPSCDTAGATAIPSDRDGMRRLERVTQVDPTYRGTRYYVFGGGCLTFVFRLGGDTPGEALALASQAVGVVSRVDLAAQVSEDSDGRLSLDPHAGRSGQP